MQIDVGAADADHFITRRSGSTLRCRVSEPLVITGPESDLSYTRGQVHLKEVRRLGCRKRWILLSPTNEHT